MLLNNNSLIMQWNKDENGNPMSWHIPQEVQQISPTHGVIQLVQVPDQHQRVKIVTEENIQLTEVFNIGDIVLDSFYVDYGVGIVRFHESQRGKLVKVNYYGRGVILISDSRIFHRDGENITDTWDNILARSQDALDLIESAGGLVNAMKEIDEKVEEGNKVADRIENFITETQFYGYTITLSQEAFVVKASEDGEVAKTEIHSIYTDVVVYQGAKQIVPVLSIEQEYGCSFKIEGQRVKLSAMDINVIKASAVLNIDCGDGLVAQRKLEVTKVFDGVSQYSVEMTNPFYSFEANSTGAIEEEQTIICDITVTKANLDYTNYLITVQNAPNGLRYKIGAKSVEFTSAVGSSLPSVGSCLVVVTIDGVSYNKTFAWNKTRKGEDAKSLTLIGGQIIRYETPDYSDVPTPYRSTVTAKTVGLSGTPKWYVKNNSGWNMLTGQSDTELTFLHNDSIVWGDKKETTIKCELEGYEDELTLVKLASGVNGSDAITVVLTNETHTVAIDNSGEVHESEIGKVTTSVLAFVGTQQVTPIVSKGQCDGCDISINKNVVQLVSLDNSFSTATAIVNVNVNGITIPKIWTISKAKQGTDGATGENGSSYILNIIEGTRSFTYSQINLDPRPAICGTFMGVLYENGTEITEGVSYYWIANGHLQGSSLNKTFTPTITKTFDESILNNDVQLTVTYKGNKIVQTIPISVTKDANGLDWVQEWDDTKVDVRGNLILTPKIFAGSYDQENDLVTGVAVGKDVLNDGNTIGVAGYQNNKTTFLLDTDGTLMVGNPFEKNSTGLYFDGENFTLKVNSLSIEGTDVATTNDLTTKVDEAINSAKEEVKAEIDEVMSQVGNLDSYMNNALKDGILDEVERKHLRTLHENITSEFLDTSAQYRGVAGNPFLTEEAVSMVLEEQFNTYVNCFEALTNAFNIIVESEILQAEDVETFTGTISDFRVVSTDLLKSLTDALTSISKAQTDEIVANAKLEVKQEINDVSNALDSLETTINGDFKSGLVSTMNLTTLKSKLSQLETEKSDIDGQYKGIVENTKLGAISRTNLANAKGELDTAHDQLVAKINSAISDMLMTDAELQEINKLITVYSAKLKVYSEVAQQANADIALNLAQGAVQALNQEDIFNKLTNNGEVQGIYLQDGKVYINGEYINSRNLKAVRNDGTETFKIDSEGNVHIKANSFYLVGDDTNIADKDYVDNAIDSIIIDDVELTQEQVFNALTNNGQTQGVYLQNGKIYLNGEYIKSKSITGDKISAGVITALNGKSTINLDNGAMNLGTTSDSSYLQWTGSDLNIKAKNISIGTSSVATSTDVGNAKNEAINSANSNTANTLKGYYTKTQTDSAIKVAKDEINLGVSQTYETKTNVDSKINAIQVGGRNLIRTVYIINKGCSTFSYDKSTNTWNCVAPTGSSSWGYGFTISSPSGKIPIERGKTFIVSLEVNPSVDCTWNHDVNNSYTGNSSGGNDNDDTSKRLNSSRNLKANTWTKCWFSYTAKSNVSYDIYDVNSNWGIVTTSLSSPVSFKIRNIQGEYGNKPTDWSPAPEDVSSDINNAKQEAISSANNTLTSTIANYYTKSQTDSQIKVAKDAINLGVSQTYETKTNVASQVTTTLNSAKSYADTKKNEAISSANNTLNSTIANYYTKSQTDSAINVAKDAINLGVNNTYETKTNVATKVNQAVVDSRKIPDTRNDNQNPQWYMTNYPKQTITEFKSATTMGLSNVGTYGAVTTVVPWDNSTGGYPVQTWRSHGTNATYERRGTSGTAWGSWRQIEDSASSQVKANTAKNDAITSANNTLNTTIANYYTKTQTDSQINVAKNAITQSVANTYETKTEVTNKINAVQIGGTNLVINSPTLNNAFTQLNTFKGTRTIVDDSTAKSGKHIKVECTTAGTGFYCSIWSGDDSCIGKKYTWSFWAKMNKSKTLGNIGHERGGRTSINVTTEWQKFSYTWTYSSSGNRAFTFYPNFEVGDILYIKDFKIEEGTKATDWSPAPKDMETTVSNLTQRVSSAESKITDTAITNVVKQNFYTKTETNNQITSKGYQTASQVQQTVDNLQIKFTQSGGYNLIRNSSGLNGTQHWIGTATLGTATNTNIGGACDKYMYLDNGTTTSERFAYSSRFKLKPSTTYTLTGWFHNFTKCPNFDVFVLSSTSVDSSDTGTSYTNVHHLINAQNTNGTWKKYTISFTTPAGCKSGVIRIDNNGYNSSGTNSNRIHWSALILSEGSLEVPWSPHPNEVYDGITQIDKDGIKVSTSKGAYTRFSPDGMNSYNNSSVQTLGIRNGGLTIHNGGEYVGFISQSQMSNAGLNGISIANANQGEYIAFGWDNNATDPNAGFNHTHILTIYKDNYSGINGTKGINMFDNLNMQDKNISNVWTHYVNGSLRMNNNATLLFDATAAYPSAIWEETSSGNLAVFGDNGVVLGYKNGATNTNIFKIAETNDSRGCKINSYEHWNFNGWTMYNMQSTYNGFSRTSADYVKMFKSSTSSESNFCVELANDYVTYFNIQANNYADGGKYIARFHYHNGTAANIVGVHFYRAINMHGFNISNVGNMNVFALATEEVVANDIKIVSPYAVASRNGEVESLSVVKSTDDITEHNDTVSVVNGRAEVYLPIGLAHMGYLVQATPNKLVKVAVTEKLDDHFVIEVDSDEEVEVDYCIKAFQPNYATRVATYGELQGEESPQVTTSEEAGECDEVQYFNEIAPLDYVDGDSLTVK